MPRIAGNEQYYNELQIEMDASDLPMRDAEINMLYRCIKKMRLEERKNHAEIATHMAQVWGLSQGAYYTRLGWVREKYPCP